MTLNAAVVGKEYPPVQCSWDFRDAIVYALGVGAGVEDPAQELSLTTQNSAGVEQQLLPTFAVLKAGAIDYDELGGLPLEKVLHAEQSVRILAPLPADATVNAIGRVESIYDKGSAALVTLGTRLESTDGETLAETLTTMFVRDAGGFGGDRGPKSDWTAPTGTPDLVLSFTTRPDQALLYRLSGDYNPLHSDPDFARKCGFDTPILHGLCTYGIAGRLLVNALCDGDAARFGSLSARFARPVLPGQRLTFPVWREDGGARFQGLVDERLVLDCGIFRYRDSTADREATRSGHSRREKT